MTYSETIEYLFNSAPLFQNVGGDAYKEGLSNTHLLDNHFGHPHSYYQTIHVAGTNGKGSCAHTLAAALQHKGLRVGLYTSPHLVDFRERIRVNGKMIPEEYVIDFVENERTFFEPLHPSFFELTTALAFKYFQDEKVDVAIIEVGLGGRLDCTNIITPRLSVITNISFDHTQFLGNTLAAIATEKAGIIKPHVPVVIGESTVETRPVFEKAAQEMHAPITFAEDEQEVLSSNILPNGKRHYITRSLGEIDGELAGDCQVKNTNTLIHAFNLLAPIFNLTLDDMRYAFMHVCEETGLQGRWQTIGHTPDIVCDTGHNTGGWQYLSNQLQDISNRYPHIHVVFGMAADKDIKHVLAMLPTNAQYYWTRASVKRAMNETEIARQAAEYHLKGTCYTNVAEAYEAAVTHATPEDFIYIGGSCFVVADLLKHLQDLKDAEKG